MESSEMRENMPYWAEVRGLGQGGLCRASVARPLAKPEAATASTVSSKLTFNVNREGKSDGCDARRRGELEATSSRACTDVLLDLMYVVTSCVLFDVVRALRRHTACGLKTADGRARRRGCRAPRAPPSSPRRARNERHTSS